jgi:hypothetical protein
VNSIFRMFRLLMAAAMLGLYSVAAADAPVAKVMAAPIVAKKAARFAKKYGWPLEVTGLAFYKGELFAGSNLGMLRFRRGVLEGGVCWDDYDSVVDGAWPDPANGLLWTWLPGPDALAYFDGATWKTTPIPQPKADVVMRGDIMAGYRGYSNGSSFWLEGARHAWTWVPKASIWQEEASPPVMDKKADPYPGVSRLIVASNAVYFVMRHDPGWDSTHRETVSMRTSDGSWRELENKGGISCQSTASVGDSGYILTTQGSLLVVTRDGISPMETAPDHCVAITATTHGTLLAAFRGGAICDWRGDPGKWVEIFHVPAPAGENSVYLAEADGSIAYAMISAPRFESGKPVYDSGQTLWLFDGTQLQQITWPPLALGAGKPQ